MSVAPIELKGQIIAFTGTLAHLTQTEAAKRVLDLGGMVSEGINLETTALVVGCLGWPTLKNGELSSKFRKANQRIAQGANLKILSESVFLKWVGMNELEETRKSFSIEIVCQTLSLPSDTLRRWEHFDLIRSVDGQYDMQDLVSLQTLIQLLAQGVSLDKIRRNLQDLKDCCGDFARPLAQLKTIVNNRELLSFVSQNRHMTAQGQILFGFDSDTSRVDPVTPDEWFDYGVELETEERFPEAIKAYTKAIELDYESAVAMFNLANVYRRMGDLLTAERFYQQTVEQNPSFASAFFNLGTLQALRGRTKAAVASLRKAAELQPTWADAHFNLAIALEACDCAADAEGHWVKCLELTPSPEMAKVAREHIPAHRLAR